MSLDDSGIQGFFTDLEIASGIPGLVYGKNKGDDDDGWSEEDDRDLTIIKNQDKRLSDYQIARETTILKVSKKCLSTTSFKCKVIKMILEEDAEYIVNRYAGKEGLSEAYVDLIWRQQCLSVLIKGMLGKVAKIKITSSLVLEIECITADVIDNRAIETSYHRVGVIQKFIHRKVDEVYGPGACLKLPVKHMRNLLSAARLHIGISEIVGRGAEYLNTVMQKSREAAEKEVEYVEELYPSDLSYLMSGKRFYPKWRVRHLKHISYYSKESTRGAISKIEMVDENIIGDQLARRELIDEYIYHDPRLS